MTTFTAFQPPQASLFSFLAVLDGTTYTVVTKWSTFGQRWMVEIDDQSQNVVLFTALVGSPSGQPLSSATWADLFVTMTTASPHGYQIGETVSLTIAGMVPAAYDGQYLCEVTGPSTFQYAQPNYPGLATVMGTAGYDISMTAGLFASTLIYREATGQFEASP